MVDATIGSALGSAALILGSSVTIWSGFFAAWALISGKNISRAAENGLGVGFLVGFFIAVAFLVAKS